MAVASGLTHSLWFPVHAGCQCIAEPHVIGVKLGVPRLTGAQIFSSKSKEEQDQAFGPEAAQAVRDGLPLTDLVGHSHMEDEPPWITQKPLKDIPGATPEEGRNDRGSEHGRNVRDTDDH